MNCPQLPSLSMDTSPGQGSRRRVVRPPLHISHISTAPCKQGDSHRRVKKLSHRCASSSRDTSLPLLPLFEPVCAAQSEGRLDVLAVNAAAFLIGHARTVIDDGKRIKVAKDEIEAHQPRPRSLITLTRKGRAMPKSRRHRGEKSYLSRTRCAYPHRRSDVPTTGVRRGRPATRTGRR